MNKKVKYLLHFLGPIIFIYILFQIDFSLVKKGLADLNIYLLLGSVLLMIIQVFPRSQKWQVILRGLAIKITRLEAVSLYWLGTFVGVITPGRLGELIKVYFLKRKGYSAFNSFVSVLIDRITDILLLLCLGFLASLFFLKQISLYILILGLALLVFLALFFFLIDKRILIKKIFPIKLEQDQQFSFSELIKKFKVDRVILFLFYLVVSWLGYFFSRYLVVLSLDLKFSFLDIILISALTAIVTMLPISIAGLGTREAAVIYLFGLFAISKELALLYSLIIFSVDLLTLSLGIIPYFRESVLINKVKQID